MKVTVLLLYSWVFADRSVTDYEFFVHLRLVDEAKHLGKYTGRQRPPSWMWLRHSSFDIKVEIKGKVDEDLTSRSTLSLNVIKSATLLTPYISANINKPTFFVSAKSLNSHFYNNKTLTLTFCYKIWHVKNCWAF